MEPIKDDVIGAIYHDFFLKTSKTLTSSNWAIKKAVPDPKAILIDMKSSKLVEKNNVSNTPVRKPK